MGRLQRFTREPDAAKPVTWHCKLNILSEIPAKSYQIFTDPSIVSAMFAGQSPEKLYRDYNIRVFNMRTTSKGFLPDVDFLFLFLIWRKTGLSSAKNLIICYYFSKLSYMVRLKIARFFRTIFRGTQEKKPRLFKKDGI